MEAPGEKLLIKLWESIADKGIGSLLTPWQKRREGRAAIDVRREELLMLAQAEVDANEIRSGHKVFLPNGRLLSQAAENETVLLPVTSSEPLLLSKPEQIADRNNRAEAIRKEIGLAKAVIHAEEELSNDPREPSSAKVSEDWLLRWRECAASVSSDELQSMWGKVLAGEVKCPGRFSLRTLEFLRNLSQDEAKAIERLSPFVVSDLIFCDEKALLESAGLTFSLLLSLQEIGIVSGVGGTGLEVTRTSTSVSNDHFENPLVSYGRVLMVKHNDPTKQLRLTVYKITELGSQILRLGMFEANDSYLRAIGMAIKKQGFDVEIGSCIPVGENQVQMFDMQRL